MDGTVVASGTLPSFIYESVKFGDSVLHRIEVTGPINLAVRIPLYKKTLETAHSSDYFCILDNRAGYENTFSYADMAELDTMLIQAGIRNFYGATVSTDPYYTALVKLAQSNMELSELGGELLATNDYEEAEEFIMARLHSDHK